MLPAVVSFPLQRLDNEGMLSTRNCVKGYLQIPDIDYQETFAPTARVSTIRTLLQHAVQNDLIVHQMDIKSAYLNAPIDREIYIEQPEGFRKSGNSGETLVCNL